MSRWKHKLLALVLAAGMASSTVACRGLGSVAAGLAVVGAVTAVRVAAVALTVATWYAITHPVYIYYHPANAARYYVPAGVQVYVISRSSDGYWYYIRTSDGRQGWVRASALRGCHRV